MHGRTLCAYQTSQMLPTESPTGFGCSGEACIAMDTGTLTLVVSLETCKRCWTYSALTINFCLAVIFHDAGAPKDSVNGVQLPCLRNIVYHHYPSGC